MTTNTSTHLRVFSEGTTTPGVSPPLPAVDSIGRLCQAFEHATGWSLRYLSGRAPERDQDVLWTAPVASAVGKLSAHFRIQRDGKVSPGEPPIDLDMAGELATGIAELVTELHDLRDELRSREAELAAGVAIAPRDTAPVTDRLEQALRSGAETVDCHAAAVYLLDSATTELKLRAAWGLPRERFALSPRPLRSATGDLEALVGHAVVMKNRAIRAEWNAPEAAAAAVCVPIATATMPLGTLWFFSAREREFTDAEVNLIEILAGRLADDLEREVLMREGLEAATLKRQLSEAERLQDVPLPRSAPRSQVWDLDGWTLRGERLGGDFYDWFPHGDGAVSVALGATSGQGVAAAMLSGVLRTAIRAYAGAAHEPQQTVEQVNRAVWQAAAGLQTAALFYGLLDATGRVRFATAGDVRVLLVRPSGWQSLDAVSLALACDPTTRYQPRLHTLKPDEVLIVYTGGEPRPGHDNELDADALAQLVTGQILDSARQLAAAIRLRMSAAVNGAARHDRSVLVIRGQRPHAE